MARWMAFYPSLRNYVIETHGIPEHVDSKSRLN
jgi:hypothetical protein